LLAPHWRGPGQDDPEIYARIIQSAKISLGLLSKGNCDRHTTRTFEIPAVGGLLCAERTDEHCESFRDGVEAVFWKDANECVDQCRRLLADDALVAAIKTNGHRRYLKSEGQNESVLKTILNHEELLNRQKVKVDTRTLKRARPRACRKQRQRTNSGDRPHPLGGYLLRRRRYSIRIKRSLASICWPGVTRISAIFPSRGA
jgi:Glycosyl transferases group 1